MCDDLSYTVRAYAPGDESGIVELLQTGRPRFSAHPRPMDLWRWKHQDTPRPNIIVVAERNGKIIGCDHNTIFNVKIGNGVFTSSYGSDLAVHSDFRNRGVYTRMRQLLWALNEKEGIKFHFNFTKSPIMVKHGSKYLSTPKRTFPHRVRILARIQDAELHFRLNPRSHAWLIELGLYSIKYFNRLKKNFVSSHHSEQGHPSRCISSISVFDDRIDDFWKEVSGYHNFIVERRENYLNWRYFNPASDENCTVNLAKENGKIVGYSVLGITRENKEYPRGRIDDLLTLPQRLDIAHLLLQNALRHFENNAVNICTAMVTEGHQYSRVYESMGFINTREKLHSFYVSSGIEQDIERLTNGSPSGVHLSLGDIV